MSATLPDAFQLESFLLERNRALERLDLAWARKRFQNYPNPSDDMLLLAMHKARYECTAIDSKLRRESGEWLTAHGFGRATSDPVLPNGELPT